jgi:signal peptidase I
MEDTTVKTNKKKEFISWVITIAAALLVFCIIMIFMQPGVVSGPSMEPNYFDGDRFFIIRDWCVGNYKYEDVVCVDINGRILIKRIIGLPGDKIEFIDGKVYRNDILLDETKYLDESVETFSSVTTFNVGEGQYFVLGDNRVVSLDSRSIGTVDNIEGKTWFIFRKSWFK